MNRHSTLVISALLAGLGPLVGNGLYAGPEGSGAAILADARSGLPPVAFVGMSLELLGFAGLVVLVAWLVVFLLDTAPVAAVSAGVAGAAMVAVKVGSAGPLMVLDSIPEKLDARTADVLVSLGEQAFVVSGFLMCLAFLAAGAGLLVADFPRWLAWWATVAGGLGVVAGIVGIIRPEAYLPLPFLLLLVWMVAAAIATVMGRGAPRGAFAANPVRRPATAPQ